MSLNLQQIRDFVRGHLDIEVEDLPDVVLDVFIREGSKRIERAEERWPFYETTYDLPTVAGTRDYPFSTINPQLDSIHGIRGQQWELKYIGVDYGDKRWPRNITQTAEPSHFAVWGQTLRLYPDPDNVYTLIVRAYRKATDWVSLGAGQTPDLPDELHNTVATWALSKAYNQQEDLEMGAMYERQFADELNEFRRRLNNTPQPQPLVLNSSRAFPLLPVRMRYDWE